MRARAHRVLDHLRRQWMGALALFLVLTGGVAYAANTIASGDIIDGEVKTADLAANAVNSSKIANGQVQVADIGQGAVAADELANGQVKAADIGDGEVKTAEIANGQVQTADIGGDQVRGSHVLNDNLAGADIAANTLKGADIDEPTLSGIGGPGGSVRGLRFDVRVPEDGANIVRTVLDLAPLRLTATCSKFGSDADARFVLEAETSAQGAGIDIGYALDEGGAHTFGSFVGTTPLGLFDFAGINLTHRLVGNIVYNDPATSITIPFAVYFSEGAETARCFLAGTATKSGV